MRATSIPGGCHLLRLRELGGKSSRRLGGEPSLYGGPSAGAEVARFTEAARLAAHVFLLLLVCPSAGCPGLYSRPFFLARNGAVHCNALGTHEPATLRLGGIGGRCTADSRASRPIRAPQRCAHRGAHCAYDLSRITIDYLAQRNDISGTLGFSHVQLYMCTSAAALRAVFMLSLGTCFCRGVSGRSRSGRLLSCGFKGGAFFVARRQAGRQSALDALTRMRTRARMGRASEAPWNPDCSLDCPTAVWEHGHDRDGS